MAILTLTAEQVSNVMAQVPAAARSDFRIRYADGKLSVPDDIIAPFRAADPNKAGPALAKSIKAECGRRILAIASANTQMNLAATMAAGLLSSDDVTTYAAGLNWIGLMRARCAELIATADADFAADAKWPPLPVGVDVAALCARF